MLFEPLHCGVSSNKHLALFPSYCKCSENSSFKKDRERENILIDGRDGKQSPRAEMGHVRIWPRARQSTGSGGTDRDGEQPPGHLHHRGTAEVAGEERDVDGG